MHFPPKAMIRKTARSNTRGKVFDRKHNGKSPARRRQDDSKQAGARRLHAGKHGQGDGKQG
eukprot:m.30128 g.30128  ORF g.30128 m.30128 type:complete len:61 (+) comp4747_c0_seq1:908-1090(+)